MKTQCYMLITCWCEVNVYWSIYKNACKNLKIIIIISSYLTGPAPKLFYTEAYHTYLVIYFISV